MLETIGCAPVYLVSQTSRKNKASMQWADHSVICQHNTFGISELGKAHEFARVSRDELSNKFL